MINGLVPEKGNMGKQVHRIKAVNENQSNLYNQTGH